jgi:hypothetical protein
MIYHLVKEKGYTLDGARIALTTNKKINEAVEMIDSLEFVKSELLKLKNSLVDKDEKLFYIFLNFSILKKFLLFWL